MFLSQDCTPVDVHTPTIVLYGTKKDAKLKKQMDPQIVYL